jgi:SNF2 family DNA or RNA helicase
MTGTPLENRVDEMIFLISMLNTEKAEEIRGMRELSMAPEFREKVAPVYLRRTREDVLKELPEKVEKEEWCRLGAKELEVYKYALAGGNFTDVRRVSWNAEALADSAKAARLLEIADQARDEGRKIIVFSFFLDTIRKVQELLGDRVYGPISGSIPAEKRQELVDQFGQGPDGSVLLCQIVAGGVGLNIQAASVVVICEPQWKPSTETQAISRVYRMGQARSVEVFRLLAENTVDEYVLQILKGKSEIFAGFADESSAGDASMDMLEKQMSHAMAKILEEERKKHGVVAETGGDTTEVGGDAAETDGQETEAGEAVPEDGGASAPAEDENGNK